MHLIKLSATDSTSAYLKELQAGHNLPDFTVVQASSQSSGRGQRGNRWESEDGKNLTFSVLKKSINLSASVHFAINAKVSLAVYEVLESLGISDLSVKWPNDIMSGTGKICGILIENQLQGQLICQSIIGIGMNVNQVNFKGLPQASSLKKVTGREFDLDSLLARLVKSLQIHLTEFGKMPYDQLLRAYEKHLFRKNRPCTFSGQDGILFPGIIQGVQTDGKLRIQLEEGQCEAFDFKELRFHY